ncbi:hypothetical protein SAMN05421678_1192 [Actinopolymorpha cephalotaxi]|uniref:Uncharacterized protein n=1 Tax=Actinopolymorpha cephalotaxi TaxID=504797 RepID=A0A1I3AEA2_9ACTN|nr:hypothetical protein [Actinopolymorpha cephalotaxi]SFH48437.1 hypothetical protein SAMN05421678_1192 [Actinopolymorpha cephalotaxi]
MPPEGQGGGEKLRHAAPTMEIQIPVTCRCGSDHGNAGGSGCGRFWLYTVSRVTS